MTLNTDLSISNSSTLTVNNGLTLANGHKVTIASTGNNTFLSFTGLSQTLGGTGEVVFGGTSGTSNFFDSNLTAGNTLTIGSGVLVHSGATGQGGNVRAFTAIANAGTISSDGGKLITISSTGPLTNTGTLSATGTGSVLTIAPTTWSSSGSLVASATGTLNLGGTFTTLSLAGLNGSGGTVNINGTLDNSGQIFTLTPTTGNVQLGSGGRILNGTVASAGAQLVVPTGVNGTLDGVTLNTDLSISNSSTLTVNNGLTLANGHKVTIASTGNNTFLSFTGLSQTLGGTGEVVFGGTSGTSNFFDSNLTAGNTLTIGSGVLVHSGASGQGGNVRAFTAIANRARSVPMGAS